LFADAHHDVRVVADVVSGDAVEHLQVALALFQVGDIGCQDHSTTVSRVATATGTTTEYGGQGRDRGRFL